MIRLYALLHDVTHIPLGHSIEDELKLLVRHDENEERIQHFLGTDSEIGGIIKKAFGQAFLDKLLHVYRWDGEHGTRKFPADEVFIHDLVSNTVCADLLDYLRRDNYFCNLASRSSTISSNISISVRTSTGNYACSCAFGKMTRAAADRAATFSATFADYLKRGIW
jgi:HD superfamily phosphohydrolase